MAYYNQPNNVNNASIAKSTVTSTDGTSFINPDGTSFVPPTSSDPNTLASQIRLAGLPPGAEVSTTDGTSALVKVSESANERDWRVKISCPVDMIKNSPVFKPLQETGGLVFPYLPTVSISHTANYSTIGVTHNNFPFYAYQNSQVDEINVSGEFSVQDSKEALYWVGAVHFLRTVTKMFFGQGDNVGNPPPICEFNGYGDFVFNKVPVVIKNFNIEMPKDVDYIPTTASNMQASNIVLPGMTITQDVNTFGDNVTFVPSLSTINVTMAVVYSREKIKSFNLTDFAAGKMITGSGRGFI